MYAGQIINFLAQKNQSYTLYFPIFKSDSGGPSLVTNATTYSALQISKDGGSFSVLTNTPVNLGNGWYSLILTASEMNANFLLLAIRPSGSFPSDNAIRINTYTELASAPSVNDNLLQKIEAVFQYLFLKRTITATAETLYKSDDTTPLSSNTVSDNGTTFTKGKQS